MLSEIMDKWNMVDWRRNLSLPCINKKNVWSKSQRTVNTYFFIGIWL